MLDEARAAMIEQGFDPGVVDVDVVASDDHDEEILRRAADYDAVVMDEADPEVADRIFGTLPDRIARHTGDPVIIVRRHG
jgi:nucleotide-binding universal stress UspA family protein